mmetsp:Transcript_59754/g.139818  ORF Transcript_59754/g.139818 Transcript_59754/m.139818 type:complete len:86 (+) Transcript_59754:453-710(+)
MTVGAIFATLRLAETSPVDCARDGSTGVLMGLSEGFSELRKRVPPFSYFLCLAQDASKTTVGAPMFPFILHEEPKVPCIGSHRSR